MFYHVLLHKEAFFGLNLVILSKFVQVFFLFEIFKIFFSS